jgi:hypothetical protein
MPDKPNVFQQRDTQLKVRELLLPMHSMGVTTVLSKMIFNLKTTTGNLISAS